MENLNDLKTKVNKLNELKKEKKELTKKLVEHDDYKKRMMIIKEIKIIINELTTPQEQPQQTQQEQQPQQEQPKEPKKTKEPKEPKKKTKEPKYKAIDMTKPQPKTESTNILN